MGLEQGGISPSGKPLETSHPTPPERGYSGLKIPRREFLSLFSGAALTAVLPGTRAAFADPMGDGGGGTYQEGQLRELPGGGVEYTWPDGKSVLITNPRIATYFGRTIQEPLVDIYTGKPRPAFPLHQELKNYIDMADATRLVVNNDPTLADRLANGDPVSTVTIDRVDATEHPEAIYVFHDLMMKPTDDPEHPNDIRLSLFFNEDCPVASSRVVNIGDTSISLVQYDFYLSVIAQQLSQASQVFKNAPPDTRFVSFSDEGGPATRLMSNLMSLKPFEIIGGSAVA